MVRVESAQTPLSVSDLNTRLLTQQYAKDAIAEIEKTADTIIATNPSLDVQKKMLEWKIYSAQRFKSFAFQTSPKLA
ncbi:hypothetical protein P278_05270 [Zhouia amylolytica AD3]|uniref:Uncharacterized protein n=1 Tax=Zhouia amylolytica AD3 TaxID=1286632 RepID=W2UR78_9FLAO|nr:hypothetical protein P278_05270 [Zhouia amylolytica AD3]